jgi:hypothetical protein
MRTILLLIGLLAVPLFLLAQPAPDTLWTRVLGGAGADIPSAIRQTSDGGYIIAGKTSSFGAGGYDALIIKLDSSGNTEWQQTYGTPWNDKIFDIRERSDGNYIAACAFRTDDNASDKICVLHTTADGDSESAIEYRRDLEQLGGSIHEAGDGSIVLSMTADSVHNSYGFTGSRRIYHINPDGTIRHTHVEHRWYSSYGEGTVMSYGSIDPGLNETCIIMGNWGRYIIYHPFRPPAYTYKAQCFRFNIAMDSLQQIFSVDYESAKDISSTADGGSLILTSSAVYRLNNNGAQEWHYRVPNPAVDLCPRGYNGYALASIVSGLGDDIEFAGYDSTGLLLWRQLYGGDRVDRPVAIEASRDSGFIVLGTTTSFSARGTDIYVVKTGPDRWEPPVLNMELIAPGPPAWGYRLIRTSGSADSILMGRCCFGTYGRVSGEAARYWRPGTTRHTSAGDSVSFGLYASMDGLASLDTFWLVHPTCDGPISWSSVRQSGTLSGPFSVTADPLTIQTKTCAVSDSGIVLDLVTASEPHVQTIELWRSTTDSMHYQLFDVEYARGGVNQSARYHWLDTEVSPEGSYWYRFASIDSFGWRQEYPQSVLHTTYTPNPARIEALTGYYDESHKIVLNFSSSFEHRMIRYDIMRSDNSEDEFINIGYQASVSRTNESRHYQYNDFMILPGHTYRYFIRSLDSSMVYHEHRATMAMVTTPLAVVYSYSLSAYPNPFNSEARVVFTTPQRIHATVDVFNIDGQKVATLTDGDWDAGRHELVLDGSTLSSGIYLVHMRTASYTATHKLVLLK